MEGRRPAAAVSPPCSGAAAVSAVNNGRPASTRPHPAAPRTLPRCPVPRTPTGFRARSAQPADSDSPDARTPDAAGGHRQLASTRRRCGHPRRRQRRADTTATPCWTADSSTVHRHPMSDQERDRKLRHRPAPPRHRPWQGVSRYDPAGRVCGKASENTSTTDCNRKVAGASLTEQAKASGREHQIELWCYPARDTSRPDSRSLPLWVTKPSGSGPADWAAYLPSCPRTAPAGNTVLWMFT
jgi:hypothetical protein